MPETEHMQVYNRAHQRRFDFLLQEVKAALPEGATILDFGSHFLAQTTLLAENGYKMLAFDVAEFAENPIVQATAEQHGIEIHTTVDLPSGRFAEELPEASVDAIVMSEILEHLAFNPLLMWKSIFRVLKPDGKLFMSTPNSLRLSRCLSQIRRIMAGDGIGVRVSSVLGGVTYGHHWKEYSRRELICYFASLGIPKTAIEIHHYCYRKLRPFSSRPIIKGSYHAIVDRLESWMPRFRPELFVIVHMPGHPVDVPSPPSYF